MPAPKEILDLVARFELHLDAYKSGAYNETQLRRDFLDPFFKALGWDVDNTAGYAEAYRDVVLEDSVRISGTLESPDYSFGIGKDRKFFLEAKKPSIDIRDGIPSAYQLRRYAWSAKLPLSILSDFEELAIYDGRIKPAKDDAASTARVFYCTFREYAEKWDWIASVFSRDAVLKGAFDKYAAGTRSKRGTTQVDDDFLSTIEGWREQLARNLALRNPGLTQREVNFAVQRILDRIVFLRIAEDRGIEPYGRLLKLIGIAASQIPEDGRVEEEPPGPMGGPRPMRIYPQLCEIFERADARYNSGLFHFSTERNRDETPDTLTLHLHLDDAVLKDIIIHLYYPNCDYAFAFIPAEILGHVYEQFLGKVIRLTEGHRAVVEEKPEVRKAGGVYYTPTYIVDYIVQQTVGPLIEGKTPNQVEKLHILDPACGSGSFLLGAYEFLLDWHLRYYLEHNPAKWAKGKDPAIYETAPNAHGLGKGSGNWRLTTSERKRILLNNLYGVDIDSQAVEVTKLSLLLKVLEGEAREYRGRQIDFHRVLPDLGKNIKCGNSLIGPDFYQQTELDLLDDEERLKINVFDWDSKDGFAEIMKTDGFDVVVGNPPYIPIEMMSDQEKNYYQTKHHELERKYDSAPVFILAMIDKLKRNGRLGFISSVTWQTGENYPKLRKHLFTKAGVETLINLPFDVFKNAYVDTGVYVLTRRPTDSYGIFCFPKKEKLICMDNVPLTKVPRDLIQPPDFKIVLNPTAHRILQKASHSGDFQPFGEFTISTQGLAGNRFEASRTAKNKETYPLLVKGQARRYILDVEDVAHVDMSDKPSLRRFYESGPKLLIRRVISRQDRILVAYCKTQMVFKKDINPFIFTNDKQDVFFTLGVLNSRLISYLYLNTSSIATKDDFRQTTLAELRRLPIPKFSKNNPHHNRIISLVQQMMELQRKLPAARTPHEKTAFDRQIAAVDQQIDRLVYDLYDLTKEEISIVEKSP